MWSERNQSLWPFSELLQSWRKLVVIAAAFLLLLNATGACVAENTFEKRISAGSDDAEQRSNDGTMYLDSTDLELAVDLDGSIATNNVGMRFNAITIPRGASITNAYIQFKAQATDSGAVTLTIQGEAADNAVAFTTNPNDITGRTKTAASTAWSPPAWNTIGEVGTNQRTPNISSIIQEIVNRSGWTSGNSLVVIIYGSGTRTADSYESDSANAPLLHVEYTVSGHWKLDESSGTTVSDSSGFNNNGTVTGTASWTPAIRNNGFSFNGSTKIQIPGLMSSPKDISVAAWANLTVADNSAAEIISIGNRFVLRLDQGSSTKTTFYNGSGYVTASITKKFAGTGWHHFAATFDDAGNSLKLYVDGVLVATTTTTASISYAGGSSNTIIGRHGLNGESDYDFTGMMDDVRVYGYAISAAQVAQLHGLVGHWKFSEGSGTTASDSTGMANVATLSGGATWETTCAGYKAMQTNGTGAIAQTNASFAPPSEGTVAFWMRGAGNPAGIGRLMGIGGDWEIRQATDGSLSFDFGASPYVGNEPFSTQGPVATNGRWYHIAAVFNDIDNSYSVYIDGELLASGISPVDLVPQGSGILSFGTRTGSSEYWNGALRDVRIYNRRLGQGEIAELSGFAAHWKLDEANGSLAADSSGLGRSGTVLGNAAWTAGRVSNSFQFDGATKIQVTGTLGSPKNVTLAAWANLTTSDLYGAEVVSIADNFVLRLDSFGNTEAVFYTGSAWIEVPFAQNYAGTGWHHFAAVFDDDQNYCRLYVDGVQKASLSTTASISYDPYSNTSIGRHAGSGTNWDFTGKIDDVRVYSRALCAEEIQTLYDLGSSVFGGVKIIKWVEIQ